MENKNQPAFPMYNELGNLNAEGLTKREYFAGLAMQGMLASMNGWDGDEGFIDHLTKHAVKYADELLTQLKK